LRRSCFLREGSVVTRDGYRALEALEWAEREAISASLPLRRIVRAALGGDDARAARVVLALALDGYVTSPVMGGYVGWLTPKGRVLVRTFHAA
jgi:hypothetical protein